MNISKRCFVRIISFLVAAAALLAVWGGINASNAGTAKQQLEYSYLRAVEDLSMSLDNIKNTLNKGMYASSPEMLSQLSNKLKSDASGAKVALSQLPVENLNLENTYKFLSQVGNYANALAEKCANGETLSDEEKENIRLLYEYAGKLSGNMWNIEQQIGGGYITFDKVNEIAEENSSEEQAISVTDGFTDFDQGTENYPTLIYDGPFSDHIMQKEPLLIKGRTELTSEQAMTVAMHAVGSENVRYVGEETGNMPCWSYECENAAVSVTKAGGLICYLIKYRSAGDATLTVSEAEERAEDYLDYLGVESYTDTYYEVYDGTVIFNFAAEQDDVTMYTDLIKVGVALDNGEIMSFDARGYITNHYTRTLGEPQLSLKEASARVSHELTIRSHELCVIPTDGANERFCYEFSCIDSDSRQVLVYINADTGAEEQILLLEISSFGTLTV